MTWPSIAAADVPRPLVTEHFRLAPLGPEHNDRDHAAWMSSIDHIRATPGFGDGTWGPDEWPFEMTPEMNLGDLEMHRGEFDRGEAFAYTVLDPDSEDVIGCVYVDPDVSDVSGVTDVTDMTDGADVTHGADAMVRSWVRVSHAHLDASLARTVDDWLRTDWPFGSVRWPGRTIDR